MTTTADPLTLEQAKAALTIAQAKLSEFQAHHDVAVETIAANRKRVIELSFDIENGDADARRKASKLLGEIRDLEADVEHVKRPALLEAQRRDEAAKAALAREADRGRAEKAREFASRLAALGAGRDEAFAQARDLGEQFDLTMNELRLLSAPVPTRELVEVNMKRALDVALAGIDPEARPVSPLQRHSFKQLYAGWAEPTLNWAAKILGAEEREAA